MNARDRGPRRLQENVGVWKSRVGAFFPGSHTIFRGHDLHADLKDLDWLELYVFGITGRRFPAAQLRLLHSIWTYTSYPDVRLWNNRVAALAGTTRSTATLGVAAALAVSEASLYGGGILTHAIDFLIRTRHQVDEGESLVECLRAEMAAHRIIAGYGRPLTNDDERNQHLLALARRLGLDQGPHLRLALAIEDYLSRGRWRKKMNYGGLTAALVADLGFSPREYNQYWFPAFLAGMPPCFIDAVEHPEGTLYPLACADIAYDGCAPRLWPGRSSA